MSSRRWKRHMASRVFAVAHATAHVDLDRSTNDPARLSLLVDRRIGPQCQWA
jgi:hypothetical protein